MADISSRNQTFYPDDPNLRTIYFTLKNHFNPSKFFIFGSRARGEANADSDYDLFLVIRDSDKTSTERAIEARGLLEHIHAPVDIFIYTEEEYADWKDEFSSIANVATHEGVELNFA